MVGSTPFQSRFALCGTKPARAVRGVALFVLAGLLAGAVQARGDEDLRRLKSVELELELAKKPDLYLVLDPGAKTLDVKARGMVLSQFKLVEVSRLVFHPLFRPGRAPKLPAPAIWTVAEGPGDSDRDFIAPTTLRPYSEQDERQETLPAPGSKSNASDEKPRIPSTYRVRLDIGWQLLLVNEPPRLDWMRRFAAAVHDGWLRLHGQEPDHPPLITLVVSVDDGRQLHHLFRTGMPILVTSDA